MTLLSETLSLFSCVCNNPQAETFTDLLALDGKHLADYASTKPDALTLETKGGKTTVVFVANAENQPRPKTFKETIPFDRMLPIMNLLNSP